MARRRRGDQATPEASEAAAAAESVGPEPTATLTVRGSAAEVKKQLGVTNDKNGTERKDPAGADDEKAKFVKSLKNSAYMIRVKRMTPREFNGVITNVEVWQEALPLGYQEIQDEIRKEHGGGKYRVAVIDPSSNSTVAADTFVIDGDPIIGEDAVDPEEVKRALMLEGPKSAAEVAEANLERTARLTAKQIEVEGLTHQLEEMRGKRAPQKQKGDDDARIAELDRRLTEAKHQAELEARDRRHEQEMKELRDQIAALANKPRREEGRTELTMMLEQMREDRKDSERRFEVMMSQMRDDKQNQMMDEIKALRNRPQQQTPMLELAETMLKMRKLMGWEGGADDDDEGDDDEKDDRPWWEKALDKVGGQIAEALAEKFTKMEEKGEVVDRKVFMKDMEDYAKKTADEAVARARAGTPALPAPKPAVVVPPPAPAIAIPVPPAQATTIPAPPQAAPPAEPAPGAPVKLTLEQEIVIRVGGVLEMLDREMELRPNEYHWTYEGCYNTLPEPILEKVCAAADPVAMIDAMTIEHLSKDTLEAMKAKISGNPRIMAWVKMGHDELKEWWQKKLADPKFDPFADEDEGEGEEE